MKILHVYVNSKVTVASMNSGGRAISDSQFYSDHWFKAAVDSDVACDSTVKTGTRRKDSFTGKNSDASELNSILRLMVASGRT